MGRWPPGETESRVLFRAVFLLSVPMILEMSMESVFGILDVYFVGRLGADAVAAVGLTESLLTVIFAVAIGLCMSTTALVARRIGEKQPEEASRAAVQAIALLGPNKLPQGVEQLWLLWTNFRRTQTDRQPLTIEQARRVWAV